MPAPTAQLPSALIQMPDTTQSDLADRLGIAVGTVNWYLKRFAKKGYVKMRQLQRRRLRYLITPEGLSEKAKLTASYVEVSMRLYRETREGARAYLAQVQEAGYDSVYVPGDGDLADVCRLTCMEQEVAVAEDIADGVPAPRTEGTELTLVWPEATDQEFEDEGRVVTLCVFSSRVLTAI